MKTLVISDLHIGSKGCKTNSILELLKDESYERYILVGDIIDGWLFKKYRKFEYTHIQVIRRLLKLSKHKDVIWIAGNHDEFIRKFIPLQIGNIKICDEFIENGIWFSHGDHYDGIVKLKWLGYLGTWGYDLAISLDSVFKRFGGKRSLSKFLKNNIKGAISFIVDFENEMVRQAEKRGCHTVVCGHIHTISDKKIENIRYINTGDWIENCSYIVYEKNTLLLCVQQNYYQ